jgi:hypothetical protein
LLKVSVPPSGSVIVTVGGRHRRQWEPVYNLGAGTLLVLMAAIAGGIGRFKV